MSPPSAQFWMFKALCQPIYAERVPSCQKTSNLESPASCGVQIYILWRSLPLVSSKTGTFHSYRGPQWFPPSERAWHLTANCSPRQSEAEGQAVRVWGQEEQFWPEEETCELGPGECTTFNKHWRMGVLEGFADWRNVVGEWRPRPRAIAQSCHSVNESFHWILFLFLPIQQFINSEYCSKHTMGTFSLNTNFFLL